MKLLLFSTFLLYVYEKKGKNDFFFQEFLRRKNLFYLDSRTMIFELKQKPITANYKKKKTYIFSKKIKEKKMSRHFICRSLQSKGA